MNRAPRCSSTYPWTRCASSHRALVMRLPSRVRSRIRRLSPPAELKRLSRADSLEPEVLVERPTAPTGPPRRATRQLDAPVAHHNTLDEGFMIFGLDRRVTRLASPPAASVADRVVPTRRSRPAE